MFSKVGSTMKMYNDMVAIGTTSTSLDKDTWQTYSERNSRMAGIWAPEEDQAPPILPNTRATRKLKKKLI